MKILVSKNITLDLFCKNPVQIIEKEKNGTIAISKNKKTLFYVITPKVLKNLFDVEKYGLKNETTKKREKSDRKIPNAF